MGEVVNEVEENFWDETQPINKTFYGNHPQTSPKYEINWFKQFNWRVSCYHPSLIV